jgi:hypothetical protein
MTTIPRVQWIVTYKPRSSSQARLSEDVCSQFLYMLVHMKRALMTPAAKNVTWLHA